MGTSETQTFTIEKKGSRGDQIAITGADIQTTGDAEVMNPDHHICTLVGDSTLRMELQVETGLVKQSLAKIMDGKS